MELERQVVDKLKVKLEVGSEETGKFKYISVEILQERDQVVISHRHYSGSMRDGDSKEKEDQERRSNPYTNQSSSR